MAKQITEAEISKWWEIFSGLNPVNGFLSGEKAAQVLKNSELSDDKLERVWDLADVDNDGNLDFEEFCVSMRLIFDLINGVYSDVPAVLPDFLVPSSKAHLIAADQAISGKSAQFDPIEDDDAEDEQGLSGTFEWYISPSDKAKYESIHSSNADRHVSSLGDFYATLQLPDTDLHSAWNLVNPQANDSIGKDQALVFFHILNQRYQGVRVPRNVPASLRSTFHKQRANFDISAATPQRSGPPARANRKSAFAESYLNRIGPGSKGTLQTGTDFSSSKDVDWEEVRLRKELQELENKYADAQREVENKQGMKNGRGSSVALVRRELERMLEYKRTELRKLETGESNSGSSDVASYKEELENLRTQMRTLEDHSEQRESFLDRLRSEIAAEKAG